MNRCAKGDKKTIDRLTQISDFDSQVLVDCSIKRADNVALFEEGLNEAVAPASQDAPLMRGNGCFKSGFYASWAQIYRATSAH